MTTASDLARWTLIAVLATTAFACGRGPAPTIGAGGTAGAATADIASGLPGSPTPLATGDGATVPSLPNADLRVEGGDPVDGQLGTYVWDGGGSDSPWLPGTSIQAAPGELLTVALSPEVRMSGWSAVIAPASDGDSPGAVKVGAGPSPLEVTAPEPGTWTLAVTIEFGDRGTATWFWLLEVS